MTNCKNAKKQKEMGRWVLALGIASVWGCSGQLDLGSASAGGAPVAGERFLVLAALAPPTVASGQSCEYAASPTASELSQGKVDLAITNHYSPTLLVGAQLVAASGTGTGITIQSANVQVLDGATNAVLSTGALPVSGFVPAPSGGATSYAAVATELLDASVLSKFPSAPTGMSAAVMVHVTLSGKLESGEAIESDEFDFSVNLCQTCLVTVPALPPGTTPQEYCSGEVTPEATTSPCVIGQDQSVDCQECYPAVACQ